MKTVSIFIFLLAQLISAQDNSYNVFFETDKFSISNSEKQKLDKFISSLDTSQIYSISIYGYCDDRGSINYNQALSEKRANSIKTFFLSNGFESEKIKTISGKGEIELPPISNEKIGAIRSKNRRVSIAINNPELEVTSKERESVAAKKKTLDLPKSEAKIIVIKGHPNNNIEMLNDELKVGDKIRFENLYFETGYSFLLPESKKELEKISEILVKRNNIFFTIEGHVCCTADTRDALDLKTKEINLSIARAKYIYDFLVEKGVEKYRMKYVGMKRKFPLGGDPKYDRRVEFLITYVGEQ